jgi:DNA-binding ferritin-like protein
MSNFKLKKSEFMELNLNKKVVNEAEEKELTSTELEEIKPEDEESKDEENKDSDNEETGNEETKEETPKNNGDFKDVIAEILHSRTQSHIFHWQTTGEHSLAMHQALQLYYEGIVPLIDGFVESYQGKYDIMKGYKCPESFSDFESAEALIKYFQDLETKIESNRGSVKESYLQNQIDTIVELINSTIYKLRYL